MRLARFSFAVAVICALLLSGCDAQKEDAAANWDGNEPLPALPYKDPKGPRTKVPEPAKKVRGFTVPKQ